MPKIGQVRLKQHRAVLNGYRLKSVTVSQTPGGKYYASILFQYEDQVQEKEMQRFLGLDFSMHELYRDSNGNEPAYPRYYRKAEKKLAREQRRLSKMQKGSNNRGKQRIKLAKLYEKVSDQRKDFLHNYCKYIFKNDTWLYSALYLAGILTMVVCIFLCAALIRKFGKRNIALAGSCIALGGQLLFFLNPYSLPWTVMSCLARAVGLAPLNAVVFGMIGDVVEFGQ